ncbi:hypothetical protein FNF31_05160 [Cafeteria roenbergensis]|uniref:Apple domain-containing protein n=1 Tax=Cafeteria roenbergensis TaxID=33653 RepID=A0A5A8D2L7_CAFRO|nr:hypothetical protein FNF31_05160 [Cafeteria roenbergensis]
MRSLVLALAAVAGIAAGEAGFRPPSVPLFARAPFYSVWSAADRLTDETTSWGANGASTEVVAAVRVDGATYRVMGQASGPDEWTVQLGKDIPGNDLPGMPVSLPENKWEACQQRCNATGACSAWAFGPAGCGGDPQEAQCWLKSSSGLVMDNSCRDFGTRPTGRGFPANTTAQQLSVDVLPTRTVYSFRAGGAVVNLTFTTPFVPGEAMEAAWAREASMLDVSAASADGAAHDVAFYFDATADLVTDSIDTAVAYGVYPQSAGVATTGWMQASSPQSFSQMQGQDRVSFGKLVLAASAGWSTGLASGRVVRGVFASGSTPRGGQSIFDSGSSTPGTDNPVLWASASVRVAAGGAASSVGGGTIALAMSFDPAFSYFGRLLRPYWTTLYSSDQAMAEAAVTEHPAVLAACAALDANITGRLQAAGGDDYRIVGSMAYRQSWSSTTPVWDPATSSRWLMLKEISSGSDSQTSDVIYPAFPLYGWADPAAAWQMLIPLMEYANNGTDVQYNLAWAPHHLGKYPVGDIGPSQQEQMPVEETAFMLISLAYLEERLGDGKDTWLPRKYWPLVDTWGEFLRAKAEIPGLELCTDDFLGPIPNNTNLAAKGIIGMGAYARLMRARGNDTVASEYEALAVQYTKFWQDHCWALDHYQLKYSDPALLSWSTKYNFMLQQALANINQTKPSPTLANFPFASSIIQTELDYYNNHQFNKYGVPLYSEATFAKADWFSFIGAIMDKPGFLRVMAALRAFLNDTPQRVPFSDWYDSISGDQRGFRNRAVVGGVFARLYLGY